MSLERPTDPLESPHDPLEIDREQARTAALSLAAWLVITLTAVGMLFVLGEAITGLFV